MESSPDQQPEGPAGIPAKPSGETTEPPPDGGESKGSQDKSSTSEELPGQSPSGPTGETTEPSPDGGESKGSQDKSSTSEELPGQGSSGSTGETTEPPPDGGESKGSQDKSSTSEELPGQSSSGSTGETTEPSPDGGESSGSQDKSSTSEESPDSRTSEVSLKEPPNEEMEKQKMSEKQNVEVIGPIDTQTELSEKTGILGGGMKLFLAVAVVALVAIVAQYYFESKSPPQKTDGQQVDVFLKQMKKVKARFSNQRAELWTRSEIHLKRHLQTSQPAEPVSLILTSGVRAERTMRCLAQDVASAFSTARNASVLHIDGAGKAGQDSDQVKLDIDRKLQGAFEGDKPVAVIHRLEELPPGSTLIFYRYCDHENAAYKKTFLIFTVLLGDEEQIPAEMHLSIVEEMVDDYLQKRFLSHDHPVSFNRMDLNKYGGLWSRISHLILPVAAEDRIEQEGC